MSISNGIKQLNSPLQLKHGTSEILALSDYVLAAGEIIVATDTGEIKAGNGINTWKNLPSSRIVEISNDYEQTTAGKALDALKGKDLNDRLKAVEEALTQLAEEEDDEFLDDIDDIFSGDEGYDMPQNPTEEEEEFLEYLDSIFNS